MINFALLAKLEEDHLVNFIFTVNFNFRKVQSLKQQILKQKKLLRLKWNRNNNKNCLVCQKEKRNFYHLLKI